MERGVRHCAGSTRTRHYQDVRSELEFVQHSTRRWARARRFLTKIQVLFPGTLLWHSYLKRRSSVNHTSSSLLSQAYKQGRENPVITSCSQHFRQVVRRCSQANAVLRRNQHGVKGVRSLDRLYGKRFIQKHLFAMNVAVEFKIIDISRHIQRCDVQQNIVTCCYIPCNNMHSVCYFSIMIHNTCTTRIQTTRLFVSPTSG